LPAARHRDPERRFELLSLQSKDDDTPLLPLPEVVTPAIESTLHSLLKSDDDISEFKANLMGPGPWTLHMPLTVPNTCDGMLHFSNKNKRAPIEIIHTLTVVVRVQRSDEVAHLYSEKPEKFDIIMRTPVHILSVRPCYFLGVTKKTLLC